MVLLSSRRPPLALLLLALASPHLPSRRRHRQRKAMKRKLEREITTKEGELHELRKKLRVVDESNARDRSASIVAPPNDEPEDDHD